MNWLFKEEPTHYSYDESREGQDDGVERREESGRAEASALRCKKGDRIFYYHTGDEKARRRDLQGARRRLRGSGRQGGQSGGGGRRAGEEAGAARSR